jgi:hypothetical protein
LSGPVLGSIFKIKRDGFRKRLIQAVVIPVRCCLFYNAKKKAIRGWEPGKYRFDTSIKKIPAGSQIDILRELLETVLLKKIAKKYWCSFLVNPLFPFKDRDHGFKRIVLTAKGR